MFSYPSAGAPGIPLPAAGTMTALRSSVSDTHWSINALSRSLSASVLSGSENKTINNNNYITMYLM